MAVIAARHLSNRLRASLLRLAVEAAPTRAVPASLVMTLPEPPSSNRYWRKTNTGRVYLSADAKAYRQAVRDACLLAQLGPFPVYHTQAIRLTARWYRGMKAGDLDNRSKQILDALNGLAYTDDKQIIELHLYRYDDRGSARLELTIEPVEGI
jgi:crossover junction endodeoxyribonuclease RusA